MENEERCQLTHANCVGAIQQDHSKIVTSSILVATAFLSSCHVLHHQQNNTVQCMKNQQKKSAAQEISKIGWMDSCHEKVHCLLPARDESAGTMCNSMCPGTSNAF
jgi:hypothetical protein